MRVSDSEGSRLLSGRDPENIPRIEESCSRIRKAKLVEENGVCGKSDEAVCS